MISISGIPAGKQRSIVFSPDNQDGRPPRKDAKSLPPGTSHTQLDPCPASIQNKRNSLPDPFSSNANVHNISLPLPSPSRETLGDRSRTIPQAK